MSWLGAAGRADSGRPDTDTMPDWYCNGSARGWSSGAAASAAREFHRSLAGYTSTPLVELSVLADELGVGRVAVKDESWRLGLPAFKILGASWACRQVLERVPNAGFVTATDGNHGRAVSRMAAHFATTATVFVPDTIQSPTAELIEAEGADLVWVDGDYDEAVGRPLRTPKRPRAECWSKTPLGPAMKRFRSGSPTDTTPFCRRSMRSWGERLTWSRSRLELGPWRRPS